MGLLSFDPGAMPGRHFDGRTNLRESCIVRMLALRTLEMRLIAQEPERSPLNEFLHNHELGEPSMRRFITLLLGALILIALCGCQDLVPRNTQSLLIPRFQKSEIFGFFAGLGTTFAALPDLIAMLRRRSAAGMNPRMAAIMGVFQVLWVYYGLLILSRPVIAWNLIAIFINSLSVGAYLHFGRKERQLTQ